MAYDFREEPLVKYSMIDLHKNNKNKEHILISSEKVKCTAVVKIKLLYHLMKQYYSSDMKYLASCDKYILFENRYKFNKIKFMIKMEFIDDIYKELECKLYVDNGVSIDFNPYVFDKDLIHFDIETKIWTIYIIKCSVIDIGKLKLAISDLMDKMKQRNNVNKTTPIGTLFLKDKEAFEA